MKLSPLYITFGQHQVAVETAIVDVHFTLMRWFYAMLSPEPSLIVRQVAIFQSDGSYIIKSDRTLHDPIPEKFWLLQAVKYEIVMGLVQARPDLLWFHAAAVAFGTGTVVFAAPGGGGKSTLATQLCQQGWRYLSDDVLPLELATGNILPFPQTPRVRQNTGELVSSDCLSQIPKFDVTLALESICHEPLPIRAIVFPSFDSQTKAQILPCSPGAAALELLRNCINFTNHKQAAVQEICELAKHLPTFRLSFSNIDCALESLTQIGLTRLTE